MAGEIKPATAATAPPRQPALAWVWSNAAAWLALLMRKPRLPPQGAPVAWRSPRRLIVGALLVVAAVGACMVLVDAPTIVAVSHLPIGVIDFFNTLTDYGTAGWVLVPIAGILLAVAALDSPALSQMGRLVLAAFAVRLGFVFAAVALPGLFVTILKRLIGRARPLMAGHVDPFAYRPFDWDPAYASLPSGHATNVFATLVAVGLVWPRLRPIAVVYALVIAASRIIVIAHHPSDVLAGAVAGAVGALVVRDWFAARRLGFAIGADGVVRTLPGPSWRRLRQVAGAARPA